MLNRGPVRVVKVGGSLFGYAELVSALRHWLAAQPPAANVLVAGGGLFADAVRDADTRFRLGESCSHDLCIHTLGVSARLLAALLPECRLLLTFSDVAAHLGRAGRVASEAGRDVPGTLPPVVFSVAQFLRNVEPQLDGNPLPHAWSVTADSIAARLAVALGAELVLLKSAEPPAGGDLAAVGYVDECFPRATRGLSAVRCVHLPGYVEHERVRGERELRRGNTRTDEA